MRKRIARSTSAESAHPASTLIVTHLFPPGGGGVQVKIDRWSRALPGEVAIVTRDADGAAAHDAEFPRPVTRVRASGRLESSITRLAPSIGRALSYQRAATDAVRSSAIAVVQCSQLQVAAVGWIVGRRTGAPYVVWVNETITGGAPATGSPLLRAVKAGRSAVGFRVRRWLLRRSAAVVVAGPTMKNHVSSSGLVRDDHPIVEVSPATDIVDPKSLKLPELVGQLVDGGARVAVFVGALVPLKGVDVAIEAWRLVVDEMPEARLVVVGDGPDEDRLRRLTSDLGLDDAVVFVGRVAAEEVYSYLGAAELLVGLSRREAGTERFEAFGQVFLQANACAIPVVAGNSGGVPDAVVDGVTGLLVDPESREEAAAAILELFADDQRRDDMGRNGRRRVEEDLNWAASAGRLQEVLDAVAAGTLRSGSASPPG